MNYRRKNVTEIDVMRHAKSYLEKMAEGIDPISDKAVGDADCLRQERISRCLSYVSGILGQVIETETEIAKRTFSVSPDDLKKYTFGREPLTATEIARKINAIACREGADRLRVRSITEFVYRSGLIEDRVLADGKTVKVPSEAGVSLGISGIERTGKSGTYYMIVYDAAAQQLILDHIDAIVEINSIPRHNSKLNKGQPWTHEDDIALRELFYKRVPVRDLAVVFQRTAAAIRARLVRLGLAKAEDFQRPRSGTVCAE